MRGNYRVVRASTTNCESGFILATLSVYLTCCFILNTVQAKMLLEGKHILDINAANAHGETALDLGMLPLFKPSTLAYAFPPPKSQQTDAALRNGHRDIAELLLAHGDELDSGSLVHVCVAVLQQSSFP